jgi:hypothetical protein
VAESLNFHGREWPFNEARVMALSRTVVLSKLDAAVRAGANDEISGLLSQLDTAVGFSKEERDRFTSAVREGIQIYLKSWYEVSARERKLEGSKVIQAEAKKEREGVERDLKRFGGQIQLLVEQQLKLKDELGHTVVFETLSGDIYTALALALVATGNLRLIYIESAQQSYKNAFDDAKKGLPSTNVYRLKLALDYSIFYFEVLSAPDRACHLAKQAFDDAIAELDDLSEEQHRETAALMQRLRDKLTLWTSDNPDPDPEAEADRTESL